jgi:predicted FMN-binding regulatory protein PaiB
MYLPPQFAETDEDVMRALIAAHPLGLLISASETGVQANPVPFLVSARTAQPGCAHIFRAPTRNGVICRTALRCWWCFRATTPM